MRALRIAIAAAAAAVVIGGCGGSASKDASSTTTPQAVHVPAPSGGSPSSRSAIRHLIAEGRPVYCGGNRPYAAFTFDDGPGVYTPLALRILGKAHLPATFFLVGRNVGPYSKLAKAEARRYALANHTYTHPVLPALPAGTIASELSSTSAVIKRETGVSVQLFRPPYGARNGVVDATVRRLGLLEILWNVDSADSLGANYAGITRNVEAGLSPGAIVLMHENRGQTIRALKFYILPWLRQRHIRLVTVPQLLTLDPPSSSQLRAGPNGCRHHASLTSAG